MQFLGSIIFEFIGASVRWLYLLAKHKMQGKGLISFGRVFDGKKDASFKENIEHGFSNTLLGWLTIFIVCSILVAIFR